MNRGNVCCVLVIFDISSREVARLESVIKNKNSCKILWVTHLAFKQWRAWRVLAVAAQYHIFCLTFQYIIEQAEKCISLKMYQYWNFPHSFGNFSISLSNSDWVELFWKEGLWLHYKPDRTEARILQTGLFRRMWFLVYVLDLCFCSTIIAPVTRQQV